MDRKELYIKKWLKEAARQDPPADGKERLMKAVQTSSFNIRHKLWLSLSNEQIDRLYRKTINPSRKFFSGPMLAYFQTGEVTQHLLFEL